MFSTGDRWHGNGGGGGGRTIALVELALPRSPLPLHQFRRGGKIECINE